MPHSSKEASEDEEEKEEVEDQEEEEDDAEEDEDDEEDDEYTESNNKKRKRNKNKKMMQQGTKKQKTTTIKRFFQDEASEADEEEESDVDDDSIDPNERKEAEKARVNNIYESKRTVPQILKLDEENLERFANGGDENEEEEDDEIFERDEESGQVHQQRHLPRDEDPKVFAVKCKEKMERDSVLKLINKYMFFKVKNKVDLKIFSVSSIEKFPGYVYIESTSEVNVRKAISDIPGLKFGENARIKIIPKVEVPMIYTLDESKQIDKNLKKGQLVRITKGLYSGDLAKIVDIYPDVHEAVVKMVPRLEKYDETISTEEQKEKAKLKYTKANLNQRPAKQLFNSNNYPGVRSQRRDNALTKYDLDVDFINSYHFEYNGNIFLNGLLYKRIKLDNLQVKNVVPTLEEIDMFVQGEPNATQKNKIYDETIEMIEQTKRNLNKFQKGDQVKVIEGDMINLRGVVISTDDKEVTMVPLSDEFPLDNIKNLTFKASQIVKDFKEGDHVKTQNGKTGTVIKIEDQTAVILLDNYKEEIRSFVNDLMKSNEIQPELIKNNFDYKRFDLVKLMSHDSAGLVLKAEKDNLVIIDEKGKVTNVSFFNVESKVNNKNVNYQNNYKQNITIDSSIKVVDGLHKGKIATVKNIFKDVLFLFNQEVTQTGGIFVEKANNCFLINTNINNKVRVMSYTTPINNNNKDSADPNQKFKGKDSWVGQNCIIRKGGWKGFEGVCKDADDKTVRIELAAKAKVITILRDCVYLKNDISQGNEYDAGARYDQIGKTPVHPGLRATAYNPTSPFHGQSPGYMSSPAWLKD